MKAHFGLGVVRATPQRLLPSLLGPERPEYEVVASGATIKRGDRQVAKLAATTKSLNWTLTDVALWA